jgi:regulatory protein
MGKKAQLSAFDRAMNYLTYRDRTEAEIVEYLQKKNYSEREIAEGLALLIRYGYIDDERYIKNTCELNKITKYYGKKRLAQELIQKGIPKSKIEDINLYYSEEEEIDCCQKLLEEALKRYRHEEPAKRFRKVVNWMMRRGYSYDLVHSLLTQELENFTEEMADDDRESHRDSIEAAYQKYFRMQRTKGYNGYELRMRIQRNLRSRGFSGSEIHELLNEKKEEGDFDE